VSTTEYLVYSLLIPCSYYTGISNILVACQTTEVTIQLSFSLLFRLDLPCADHHLSIGDRCLDSSYSLGSVKAGIELTGTEVAILHLEIGAAKGQGGS